MSNWDFGYNREPTDPHDPQYPPPPPGEDDPRGRGRPGDVGWRGSEGYPNAEAWTRHEGGPYDRQAAPYPITYERDDFDGRPAWPAGPAGPWPAGPRSGAPRPATRWPAASPATDQFGGQYLGGQPGGAGYPGGQPGYAGRQPGYPGSQRGGADTMRSSYRDNRAGEDPWLDDPREPRLDGPWWDPDSWPDWRRWLIPLGVAVLAAAIGAALVLLTGMHHGASAAVGTALASQMGLALG